MAQPALRDAVAARGGRLADDAPVRLRVRTNPRKDGQIGVEITGEGAHGALAERRFVASSCADAIDALGFVIALSGDEAERAAAVEASASPPASSSSSSPSSSEPGAPETPAPVATTPAPAARDEAPVLRKSEAAPSPSTPSRIAVAAGAAGTTLGEGQLGARAGAAIEWRRSLLPWIEASGVANLARTIHGGGGGADATWITGRVAVAPVGIELGPSARASVFAAADVGALSVSGSGATRVDSHTRPWFAVAAGARARWDLGARLFAGLDVAAVVPLVRDEFVFVHGGTAYRVPAVGAETAILLGVHFP